MCNMLINAMLFTIVDGRRDYFNVLRRECVNSIYIRPFLFHDYNDSDDDGGGGGRGVGNDDDFDDGR